MAESRLAGIVELVYSARGDDVLGSLLGELVQLLGVDYALISQLVEDCPSRARTLSFFADGRKTDNFEYDLPGGPCEYVHARTPCVYNRNVQELFPDDLGLKDKEVEAYVGIPLFAAGDEPIGIIAVMNRTPFDDPESVGGILKVFASRVANELEWRRREASLKQSEARFRNLVEGSIQGVFVQRDLEFLFLNQRFAEMLGYRSPDDLTSHRSLMELFHPDEHERVLDFARRRQAGEDVPDRYEVRMVRRDGAVLWLQNIVRVIEWQGEQAVQSTNLDVTERKLAEEKLQSILENVADGIFRTDEEGRMLWANSALVKMAGFKSADEMLSEISDVANQLYVNPEDRKVLLDQLRENGSVRDFVAQYKAARTGETLWCSTNCTATRGLDGRLYIDGVVRDVTESRRNEERLRRVEKLQAVGQLTGGIAHDFNNLLGILICNLDMLEQDAGNDERLGRLIATSLRAALRGADLTKRLLSFSRQTQEVAEPVNLNSLIGGLRGSLTRSLGANVNLHTFLVEDLWRTEVNAGDFEDVILNLAHNARDAMSEGGNLIIETGNTVQEEIDSGAFDESRPGEYVVLSVSDDGCGMPKEVSDQIFEPFFTTKEVGKGTGLGMSLVYGFVQRSNGYIKVYSSPGTGTTVRIFLPRTGSPDHGAMPGEKRDVSGLQGSEVVLVVDDEPDFVTLARSTLEKFGYRVLTADNADSAFTLLAHHRDVDLLFTDVVMPGNMSGLDLAAQASKSIPDLKVLLTSGFSDKTARMKGYTRFLDSLLPKPYRQTDMVRRIRQLLDGSGEGPRATD